MERNNKALLKMRLGPKCWKELFSSTDPKKYERAPRKLKFCLKKTKQREYLCLNSILEKKELQKGEQEGAVFGELEGGGA